MVKKEGRILLAAVLIVGLAGSAAFPQGLIRSIGIRFVLPFTGGPLLIGIEATTNLPFGIGTGSFLLDSEGRTLITLGADIDLSEEESDAEAYLRLTGGIYYFDPSRFLPSPLFGGGFSYRFLVLKPFVFGFAGEFLYPIAFPAPMLSLSAGWSFR